MGVVPRFEQIVLARGEEPRVRANVFDEEQMAGSGQSEKSEARSFSDGGCA